MYEHAISGAISRRHVISFSYDGRQRVVEPHLVGIDRDGEMTLIAWQLSGGNGEGWREFHADKLSGLSTTGKRFSDARPGYNPNDPKLDRIICRL